MLLCKPIWMLLVDERYYKVKKEKKDRGDRSYWWNYGYLKLLWIRLSTKFNYIRVWIAGVGKDILRWRSYIICVGNIVYRISRSIWETIRLWYVYSRIWSTLTLKSLRVYTIISQIKSRNTQKSRNNNY